MWYAIIAEDVADSLALRKATRPAHLEYVAPLVAAGRLLVAGPHPAIDADDPGDAGFTGSLLIVDFPSLEEATAWADNDPYKVSGVFAKVTVKPFKQVLP